MKIIIAIPAFNEEQSIGSVIDEIKSVMDPHSHEYRILVLDDGSSDRTKEIAEKKGALVYSNPHNMGLAYTFKKEIEKSLELGADIIAHTDADGQYDAKALPLLIRRVIDGNDLVLGSRFILKSNKKNMKFMNRMGNRAFAYVISKLTRKKISDTTTGFRAFTKEVAETIQIINNFTYTQEQIIKAVKSGFKVSEIPIEIRKTRASKLFRNPLVYAVKAWINILRIYRDYDPLKFFFKIGFIFFILGILIGVWLVYTFIRTGLVGHVPLTILSVLLILIGLQIWILGFIADMIKK